MKLVINKKYFNRRTILFALYNLAYILYMLGYLPRSVNLAALALFTIVCCLDLLPKKHFCFTKEIKLIAIPIIAIIIISIAKQVIYHDYSIVRLINILYLVFPAIDAFAIVNTVRDKNELKGYIYIMFVRMLLLFVLQNIGNFNLQAITSISFNNSYSSVFESSMAHELFFMVIIFKYLDKNILAIVSAAICMLCFKRLSFLLSIIILFTYKFIPKNKPVNKTLLNGAKVAFILSPLLIAFLVSDNGSAWFLQTFGIDLNLFATGRVYYINLVHDRMQYFAGYGSTHEFLANIFRDEYVTDIHCDLLRITWECTVVSLVLYVNNMLSLVKNNYILFIMMLYCLLESVVSHFMEGMTTWLLIYLFIFLVNQNSKEKVIRGDSINV